MEKFAIDYSKSLPYILVHFFLQFSDELLY